MDLNGVKYSENLLKHKSILDQLLTDSNVKVNSTKMQFNKVKSLYNFRYEYLIKQGGENTEMADFVENLNKIESTYIGDVGLYVFSLLNEDITIFKDENKKLIIGIFGVEQRHSTYPNEE